MDFGFLLRFLRLFLAELFGFFSLHHLQKNFFRAANVRILADIGKIIKKMIEDQIKIIV
jgi:hypothetical protein